MDDTLRLRQLLLALGGAAEGPVVTVPGDPPSKARPRFNANGRPYTPQKTIDGEIRYAAVFRQIKPFTGNVAIACLFYRGSHQRIDVDNLLKAVLDGGTRAHLWADDSQVTAEAALIEYDSTNPRVIVALSRHTSTMTRGTDALISCQACGKLFEPFGNLRREHARHCSRECGVRLGTPIPCGECGQPFRRRSGNQKLCSHACQLANMRRRNHEARKHEPAHCAVCHKPLSRPEYNRCRDCFEAGRQPAQADV